MLHSKALIVGLAGFASANEGSLMHDTPLEQLCYQLAAMATTLGIAMAGGGAIALLINKLTILLPQLDTEDMYEDEGGDFCCTVVTIDDVV